MSYQFEASNLTKILKVSNYFNCQLGIIFCKKVLFLVKSGIKLVLSGVK
jgi:hypothetical protein